MDQENELIEIEKDPEATPTAEEREGENGAGALPDYALIEEEDLKQLRRDFPELSGISSVTELHNPLRYAALRDLGLSAKEAYLATAPRIRATGKAHLRGAVPGSAASSPSSMPQGELISARELFSDLSDRDIQRLYKKVTR